MKKEGSNKPLQPVSKGEPGSAKKVRTRRLSFQALFNDNRFVAVLAIVASIILWFVVYLQQENDITTTITNVPITINYENSMAQDLGLEIIGDVPTKVDVTVSGDRYTVMSLDENSLRAQVSLSSVMKAGTYTLKINVSQVVTTENYTITGQSTEEMQVTFDQIITRTFPIEINAPGLTASEGYLMETAYADIDYITVTGPQAELEKISRCVVTLSLERELSETLTTSGTLVFLDESGAAVDTANLKYEQEDVTVTIPIYKTKYLDLKVEFVNIPKGFPIEQLGYTLSRNSILVASPSETIDNIESITVGPIDFREIDIGKEISLDITLNAGLKNVENVNTVVVTFPSYGLTTRTLDVDNFIFENLPAGYEVSPLTAKLEGVRIVGDSSIVSEMTSEDLVGMIDLSQYSIGKGRYTVSAKIYVQGKVLAWAVGEYTVDIEVTQKEDTLTNN